MKTTDRDREIGVKIGSFVESHGIKRKWVSEQTGIHQLKVKRLFDGEQAKVSIAEYCAICDALDVPLNYFIDGEGSGENGATI